MQRVKRAVIVSAALLVMASTVMAGEYKLNNVRRLDSNVYQDTDSKILIKTSLCLEMPLGEPAVLVWDGYNHKYCGKIIFLNSGASCDVDGVYR